MVSTRLFVRLHRDAHVPGARLPWVLRDNRGALLRRGEDKLSTLPAAGQLVGVLAQDQVAIRPVSLPPGRRARAPIALANAMEPFLLSEPAANHVLVLGEHGSYTLLAAIARDWLAATLSALGQVKRPPARLIVESALLERAPGRWTAVCRADGGFLVTDDGQTIALDAAHDGGVPEGLRWARNAAESAAPALLRVYHDAATPIDRRAWQSALGMAVEDAGAWDWARATGAEAGFRPEAATDVLAELDRGHSATRPRLRRWRVPLVLAAAVLGVHVGASVIHWAMGSAERAALRAEMNAVFRKSVSASEPLVDPVLQTRRALGAAQRAAGQYAPDDFMTLLGRVAAESAGTPPLALRAIHYAGGTLSLEWHDLPAASVERMAEQLRARGLRVELSGAAPQMRMSVRVEP